MGVKVVEVGERSGSIPTPPKSHHTGSNPPPSARDSCASSYLLSKVLAVSSVWAVFLTIGRNLTRMRVERRKTYIQRFSRKKNACLLFRLKADEPAKINLLLL